MGAVPYGEDLPFDVWLELCANEQLEDDVSKFRDLARRRPLAATLDRGSGGRREASRRYRELLRPRGLEHELRVALVTRGACWGGLALNHARRAPAFTPADMAVATAVSAPLAEGLCQALMRGAAGTGQQGAPGVIILSPDGAVESVTDAALAWLALLGEEPRPGRRAPLPVATVAAAARASASDRAPGLVVSPRLRVRTRTSAWLTFHGSVTRGPCGPDGRVAVVVRGARVSEILPLVASRYGLSPREQVVVRLVLLGLATREIAARMEITPNTVQGHLKSRIEATHTSEFLGVAATGRRVAWDIVAIIHIRDGRFVGQWAQPDLWGIHQQLTSAEAPEPGTAQAPEPAPSWARSAR